MKPLVRNLRASIPARTSSRAGWYILLPVLAGVAFYLSLFLFWGWIPHDEGVLSQTAERVLDGQLPHRDFDDPYTGGLALFHALAFWLLGLKLTSLRLALFFCALAFVFTLYRVAVRSGTPWAAAGVTCLCLAYSLPNYFAALPSWYLLFLVTAGILAFMRFIDSGKKHWLVIAGVLGGVGLTLKIVALFYIAAGLLFLVFHDQIASPERPRPPGRRGTGWIVTAVAVSVLYACLHLLLQRQLEARVLVHFALPGIVLGLVLLGYEWRHGHGRSLGNRLRGVVEHAVPFLLGAALPVAAFLVPYVFSGDLRELYHGAIVLPQVRFEHAVARLPPLRYQLSTVPPLALLVLGFWSLGRLRWPLVLLVSGVGSAFLFAGGDANVYKSIWESVYGLVPGITLVAAWRLFVRRGSAGEEGVRRRHLFLLMAMLALMNLVQFPYSFGIYFYYVAPLLILLAHGISAEHPRRNSVLRLPAWAFYTAFALLWLNPGNPRTTGVLYMDRPVDTRLRLPRAGLLVGGEEAQRYEALVSEVRRRSAEGSFIFAAPDCPEVYFLAARKNPTRTLYDFFDDPEERTRRTLDLLDQRAVTAIVINLEPEFSEPVAPDLIAALERKFPFAREFGNFIVAWRAPAGE